MHKKYYFVRNGFTNFNIDTVSVKVMKKCEMVVMGVDSPDAAVINIEAIVFKYIFNLNLTLAK